MGIGEKTSRLRPYFTILIVNFYMQILTIRFSKINSQQIQNKFQ